MTGGSPHSLEFMTNYSKIIRLNTPEDTLALGARLSAIMAVGDIVVLRGGLGAGKTSLARGLIGALCKVEDVPSPTYTLVQTYDGPDFGVWHFDLYRLEAETDVWELGIEEAFDAGICLIEWPERIESLLSGAELTIQIEFEEMGRRVHISGNENWGDRLEHV